MEESKNYFMLSNSVYDFSKRLVQIILPAVSSLYFGLASIWGLPEPDKVVGTLAIITTFLGVVLGISSAGYNASGAAYDGNLLITVPDEGEKRFLLELNDDVGYLEDKESITFKVNPIAESDTPVE